MGLGAHAHPAAVGHGVPAVAALAVAALLATLIGGAGLRRDRRLRATDDRADRTVPAAGPGARAVGWLAVAMAGAGTVHGAVVREHFGETAVLGAFFLALTVAQYGYALLVVARPRAWLLRLGAAAHAAILALWIYTRTAGIPFGVGGGDKEAVGLPDLIAAGFELAAIAATVVVLRRGVPSQATRRALNPGQQIAAVLVVALSAAVVATVGAS